MGQALGHRRGLGTRRFLVVVCAVALTTASLAFVTNLRVAQGATADITVNTTTDETTAPDANPCLDNPEGTCSLRDAVLGANARAKATTIAVPAGTYNLTIAPVSNDTSSRKGTLHVRADTTFVGAGASTTIVDGGGISPARIFQIDADKTAQFSGFTFQHANVTNDRGGAIFVSAGNLVVSSSVFSANNAVNGGGAIDEDEAGTITLTATTFSANTASHGSGGAIRDGCCDNLQITNSTFSSNTAGSLVDGVLKTGDGGAIWSDVITTLTNDTFTGNSSTGSGGAFSDQSDDVLTVSGGAMTGNSARDAGGAIDSSAFAGTISDIVISSNSAQTVGGGIFNQENLTVSNATIADNQAKPPAAASSPPITFGGGVFNSSDLTISASTLSGNQAQEGAGLANCGTLTMANTTVSGNTASVEGGGIDSILGECSGRGTLTNLTIYGNSAPTGTGGGFNDGTQSARNYTVRNTIIANNSPANCGSTTFTLEKSQSLTLPTNANTFFGHESGNLESGQSCQFNASNSQSNTNPQLGPLQNNGGPTKTHALLAGSPAIEAGDLAFCEAKDQRGVDRPKNVACDVGAYQARPAGPLSIQETCTGGAGGTGSFTVTATIANSSPANNTKSKDVDCGKTEVALPTATGSRKGQPIEGTTVTIHQATPPIGSLAVADKSTTLTTDAQTVTVSNPAALTIAKTCGTGVSGAATFKVSNSSASVDASVACSGSAAAPITSAFKSGDQVTIHESTVPTGGQAAADKTVTLGDPQTVSFNNAAAAASATPTPTPTPTATATAAAAQLAQTGSPPGLGNGMGGAPLWLILLLVMGGLFAMGVGSMRLLNIRFHS